MSDVYKLNQSTSVIPLVIVSNGFNSLQEEEFAKLPGNVKCGKCFPYIKQRQCRYFPVLTHWCTIICIEHNCVNRDWPIKCTYINHVLHRLRKLMCLFLCHSCKYKPTVHVYFHNTQLILKYIIKWSTLIICVVQSIK